MKKIKKIIALVTLFAMFINIVAPPVQAVVEAIAPYTIQNGIVEYKINKGNGRFTIHTADGIPNKASDNDKNLLFFNELPETSFTTFRIDGEDYVFGTEYGAKGGIVSQTTIDGYIAKTVWHINDVEITQKLTLITDPANPNVGNTKITYEVANAGDQAVNLGSRILLDTQLGSNDASPMIVGTTFVTNEIEYSGENMPISWKSADEKFAPNVIAYGLLSGWQNIEPDRMVVSHWESISQTAWDYTPNPLVNFTTVKNEYASADSAVALYFNPTDLATGETRAYETFYGIGSISDATGDAKFNVQLTSPQKLTVNNERTGYNENELTITVNLDNSGIESADLNNLVVKLGLSDELTIAPSDAMIKTITKLKQGETTSVIFKVIPTVQQSLKVAEYGVTVVYGDDYTESKKYIILPSVKGAPPNMQMTEVAPQTIYTGANKKSVVIKGSEFSSLKADNEWSMYITNTRTGVSQEISRSNIYIEDATMTIQLDSLKFEAGEYDIILNSKNFGNMSKTITMTDDEKFDRMEYGLLLIGAFGTYNTDNPVYTTKVLKTEKDMETLSADDKESILLTIRGEISSYDLSGVTVYECESGTIINNSIMYTSPISKPESTMLICRYDGVEGWSGANSFFDNFEWFSKDNESLLMSGEGTLSIGDYKFHYGNFNVTLEDGTKYGLGEPGPVDYNQDVNENVGEVDKEDEDSPVTIVTPANVIANEVFKPIGALSGVKLNIKNAVIGKSTVSLGGSFSVALPWLSDDDDSGSGSDDSKKSSSFDKINEIDDYQGKDSLVALNMEEMRYGVNAVDNTSELVGVKADGSIDLTDDTIPMLKAGGAKAGFKINSIDYPGWFTEISAGVKVASAFEVNALVSLVFETGGECIPDCIELVVGGDIIKIPLGVTPLQVGWLNKIGGGVYNLYDTVKGNFNAIPPIALKVITGYQDPTMVALEIDTISMKISLGGIRFEAEDGKIVKLPLLESMYAGFQIYDTKYEGEIYPCIDIGAGIKMNLLDIIKGESSIWLVADPRINSVFGHVSLGGKMYCGLFVPSCIPLLGGMELAAIMAELSSYRVYAGIRIIGIPLSIGYYWADKEVKFNDAWELAEQLNIPQEEIDNALAIEFNETDTNADGVMLFGGNLRKTYCSSDDNTIASNSKRLFASTNDVLLGNNNNSINEYSFDVNNQSNALFQLQYNGEMPNIKVTQPNGSDYALKENENYIVQTISAVESKSGLDEHYVFISAVEPADGTWKVETDKPIILTAMDVLELPEVKNVSCEKQGDDKLKVDWNAMNIDDGDYTVDIHISEEQVTDAVYNENMTEDELSAYYKEMAESYDVGVCVAQDIKASDKSAIVDISERLKDGKYQARVVLKKSGENLSSALSSNTFTYVNPNTPDAVTNVTAVPGGDGQFMVNFDGVDDASGYYIMIVDENGNAIEGFDGMTTTDTKVYVGNTYEQATGYDENEKPTGFERVGIFPGSKYKVQVYACNVKDSMTYMSEVVTTDTIYLPKPNPAEVGITVGGITPTSARGNVKEVTVNTAIPDVALSSNQDVKMIYKVDGEYKVDSENKCVEYEMKANTPLTIKEELLEGGSNLEFYFVNAQGDYTTEKISVSVDTIPPTLMLNKTVVESKNGDYVITGTAESNSVVYINDAPIVTSNGSFNYVGSGNNKREEISVKAVDCANNETIMLCEVIPSELSRFVSIKIKADGNDIIEEFKIQKESEAQLTVYGVDENGREYLLDNSNVSFSVAYGNDKISIDEDGVLKAEYYGDGVIMCEYSVTDDYSFEESLPVKVLSIDTVPTTIRVSNTDIDSSTKIGDVVALLSVPQSPIGVNYVYSVSDNEYVKIVDNNLVLKSQKLSQSNITVTITAQGQHVLNGMYKDIYEPIEKEVTFHVTDRIVAADVLDSILVEKGVSFDSLDLPQTTTVTLSDNTVDKFPIAWQKGAYNQNVARVYTLKGEIQRNDDITNPDEVVAVMQVSVNKLSIEKPKPGKFIYGYTLPVATRPITVTNEGKTDLTVSNIEVLDVNGNPNDKFKVSINSSVVSAGRTVEIAAIQPVAGLDAGVYNAKVIVTYGNNFKTEEDVSITVEQAMVSMSGASESFLYDGNPHGVSVVANDVSNGGALTSDNYTVTYTKDGVLTNTTPTEVGVYTVTADITNSNYKLEKALENVTLNIYSSQQTVLSIGGVPSGNPSYGDKFKLYSNGGNGSGEISWLSSNNNIATIDNSGNVEVVGVGEVTFTATKSADNNYKEQYASVKLTTKQKEVKFTISDNVYTYDGSSKEATITPSIVEFKSYSVEYVGNTTDAGQYDVVVNTTDPNYIGSLTGKLTINKATAAAQDIEVDESKVYDGKMMIVNAPEATLTYEGDGIVGTTTVAPTDAGSYTVIATYAETANYTSAVITKSFVIKKGTLSASVSIPDGLTKIEKHYGEANPELLVKLNGFVNNESENVVAQKPTAYTNAIATSVAGEYDITISGGYAKNYDFVYDNTTKLHVLSAQQSIDLGITGIPSSTIYYDDTFTIGTVGGNGNGEVTYSATNAEVDANGNVKITGTGDVTITATKAADVNHNIQTITTRFKSNKKIVKFDISDHIYDYDGSAKNVDATPIVPNFTDYIIEGHGKTDAGIYNVTVKVPSTNANYTGTTTGTLTINKIASNISIAQEGSIYGKEILDPIVTSNGGTYSVTYVGDTIVGESSTKPVNAGTYTAVAKLTGDKNHNDSTATETFTINKKTLMAKADDQTQKYNEENPELTVSYDGFEYGDNDSSLYIKPIAKTEATKISPVGKYDITVSGGIDTNYNFSYGKGTINIVETEQSIPLYITGVQNTTVYGDKFKLYANGGNGSGEISWLSSNNNIATIDNSGNVEIVAVGEVTFTATKAADNNYAVQNTKTTVFANKKQVSLAITNTSLVYNGNKQGVKVISNTSDVDVDEKTIVSYRRWKNNSFLYFYNRWKRDRI